MRHILLGMIIFLSSCAMASQYQPANRTTETQTIYEVEHYPVNVGSPSPQIGVNVNASGRPVIVNTPPLAPQTHQCIVKYEVDKRGRVIGTSTQGLCPLRRE